jgi:hypothetical protein
MYPGIPTFATHGYGFDTEDMVDMMMQCPADSSICDPAPFDHESPLHMMLPDDFYAFIMATEDDITYREDV